MQHPAFVERQLAYHLALPQPRPPAAPPYADMQLGQVHSACSAPSYSAEPSMCGGSFGKFEPTTLATKTLINYVGRDTHCGPACVAVCPIVGTCARQPTRALPHILALLCSGMLLTGRRGGSRGTRTGAAAAV